MGIGLSFSRRSGLFPYYLLRSVDTADRDANAWKRAVFGGRTDRGDSASPFQGRGAGERGARGAPTTRSIALRPQLREVVNLAGERSKQQDVTISDAIEASPFIAEGGINVHPIESVVATLEIKSVARPQEMKDSVEKALSVGGLISDTPRAPTSEASALRPYEGRP